MLIRHTGRRRVQGGAVSIGRAGRGRTECRHWSEGGRWIWRVSAAGLDLLYGGPVRECYAAPLFVVMLPPLLRGLMVRYDGC